MTALPKAGYPQYVSNRIVFDDKNIDYFAEKMVATAEKDADIVGGCCGTTPEYICRRSSKRNRYMCNAAYLMP